MKREIFVLSNTVIDGITNSTKLIAAYTSHEMVLSGMREYICRQYHDSQPGDNGETVAEKGRSDSWVNEKFDMNGERWTLIGENPYISQFNISRTNYIGPEDEKVCDKIFAVIRMRYELTPYEESSHGEYNDDPDNITIEADGSFGTLAEAKEFMRSVIRDEYDYMAEDLDDDYDYDEEDEDGDGDEEDAYADPLDKWIDEYYVSDDQSIWQYDDDTSMDQFFVAAVALSK